MTMRKRVGSILFTVAAAGAIASLSIGPALASTPHLTVHVKGGGSYKATAGTTILQDGIAKVTCSSSHAAGKISSGTYKGGAPVKVGTTKSLSFSNCTSPAGVPTFTYNKLPYLVKANSKTVKGETAAIISGTNVTVNATDCKFTVTGSAPGYYKNSNHTLYITSKLPKGLKAVTKARLTISGVTASANCGGLVKNKDHPTFTGTYKVNRKIKITSS